MSGLRERLVQACAVGGVDGGVAVVGGEIVPEGAELGGDAVDMVRRGSYMRWKGFEQTSAYWGVRSAQRRRMRSGNDSGVRRRC